MTHPKLDICKKCSCLVNFKENHLKWNSCKLVKCSQCHFAWFICVQHTKYFDFKHQSRMKSHFETLHEDNVEFVQQSTNHLLSLESEIGICNDNNNSDHESYNDVQQSKKQRSNNFNQSYQSDTYPNSPFEERSHRYFADEYQSKNSGICGLIGRALSENQHSDSKAEYDEARWHMNAAHFCSGLTEQQQFQFTFLLRKSQEDNFITTRLPISLNDIKRFYTTNKSSIINNIPCPKVFELDNHACVSLGSVINHTLALGADFDMITINKNLSEPSSDDIRLSNVKEAQMIRDEVKIKYAPDTDPLVTYIIIWSDDFEVNRTRKNRKSTWIMTATICPPKGMTTSLIHTQVIAIGKKGDHKSIHEYFMKEIEELQKCKMRYVAKFNKFVPIVVKILVFSADRPERSSVNELLSSTGNSSRRWLYSSLTNYKKIPSCKKCYHTRLNDVFSSIPTYCVSSTCRVCCDWEYESVSPVNKFSAPANYPTEKMENSPDPPETRDVFPNDLNKQFYPVKLSYPMLKSGLKFAVHNYFFAKWNKGETQAYLKLLGVSGKLIERSMKFVEDTLLIDPTGADLLNKLPLPAMWQSSCIRLDQFIETPMHHLFEGIVKSVIYVCTEFFKMDHKWTTFCHFSNKILNQLSKLNCDFCRAENFTNEADFGTGGWLAETYLGYSRVMVVLFSHIDQILDKTILGFKEIQAIVQTLNALIARLMTHKKMDVNEIATYIKIFLSTCYFFEKNTFTENDKNIPFWYKKGNFVSLLNLPSQIEQFGPVYLHWEGVRERFIQVAKKVMINMRSSVTYLCLKLEEIHSTSIFHSVVHTHMDEEMKKYERYPSLKMYKNLDDIEETVLNYECFIGIKSKTDGGLYVPVQIKKIIYLHEIIMDDQNGFHKCNQWFSPLRINDQSIGEFQNKEMLRNNVQDTVLFIPYDTSQKDDINGYCATSKNWLYRKQNGQFELPHLSKELLSSITII